jgi:hypothetical protein
VNCEGADRRDRSGAVACCHEPKRQFRSSSGYLPRTLRLIRCKTLRSITRCVSSRWNTDRYRTYLSSLRHQMILFRRSQKWLPHLSRGTQIEGDSEARPSRSVSSHLGLADGIRHTSRRSPQPQGHMRIAHLNFPGWPTTYKRSPIIAGSSPIDGII